MIETRTQSGTVESSDLTEVFRLLQDVKGKQGRTPKWFKMSHETLYAIEAKFDLIPRTEPCSTLWGIMIVFNEQIPLNEIKPIYEGNERTPETFTI
jgi:hypothetical protein